MTPAAL
jgi:hypothetical protein